MNSIEIQKIVKFINERQFEIAEESLKIMLEKDFQDRTAHFLFGVVLAKTNLLEEAEAEFLDLVGKNSGDTEALGALAIVYRRQGKLKDALGVFNEAVDLDPTRWEFFYHIADIQMLEHNLKAAFMAYARVIECNPDYAPAYNNLGIVYYESNEYNKALNAFQEAISRGTNGKFHYNYAIALEAVDRGEEAVREYEAALAVNPYCYEFRNNLGVAQAKLGRLDDAGGSFDLILDDDPFNANAWNNLGAVFAKQGFKNEAIRHFRRALEERPGYEQAQRNLDNAELDAEPKPGFSACDMILDEDITISFNTPKPSARPLSGEFMGFETAHLLDFLKYLKDISDFLPEEQKNVFLQSDTRFNMDHIINILEGHHGILRDIEEFQKTQEAIAVQADGNTENREKTAGTPETDSTLNTAEVTDFLTYFERFTASIPDPALSKLLAAKMKKVASAMQ